jgi:hypothetical protein
MNPSSSTDRRRQRGWIAPLARRAAAGGTLAAAIVAAGPGEARAWGLEAHRIITGEAAERLPPDVAAFFASVAEEMTELSLEPDTVLKSRDRKEQLSHFINLDSLDEPPFDSIPRDLEKARARFGEKRLRKNGTLPWRVHKVFRDLRSAMKRGDRERTLREAGYLAHYLGDLFQPLHLTKNYDGEETCNAGIHKAFEAEMVERRPEAYRKAVSRGEGAVEVIDPIPRRIFQWMRETYPLVDRILEADTSALSSLKREGRDYYDSMDRLAGPIAERQMSAAANAVASLWYTAWIRAGKPDLE